MFFAGGVTFNMFHAFVGLLLVTVVSFLFTTVAANAIAIVGTNPVSGMTLMTLILSSFVLVQVGLTGDSGMVSALIIGGVVCTALSVAGGFITDLKIGYWLGTTPRKQESWKFLGVLVSAATVGVVILILNDTYGFKGPQALVAPQANAMAAVIQPLMSNAPAPWILYLVGAVISLLMTMVKISAARVRARDVHSAGTEHPAPRRRAGGLVRLVPVEERKAEQRALLARNAHRVGIHRGRIALRRARGVPEIRRDRLVRLYGG